MATILFFAFLLMSGNGVECGSKERRNDDTSIPSLVTLVEQQSATIERQAAAMQVMQSQISELQRSVANLTNTLNGVLSRERTQVFFTAQTTQSPVTMGTSSPVRFDKVITNTGNGYNAGSGVFTAPVTGVYVFYVQLMKASNAHYLHYLIDKSGQGICENSLDQNVYDKSSCLTTVHVQHGEQVFVKMQVGSGSSSLQGNVWCSFSGYLVSVDF